MNQKQPQQLLQTEACRAGKVELSLFRCDIFQTTGEFHAVSWWQHRAALHNAALCFTALTHPQGTGRGCHAADKERSGRHADHIKVSHRSLNGGSSLHCECSSSAASTAAASQLVGGLLRAAAFVATSPRRLLCREGGEGPKPSCCLAISFTNSKSVSFFGACVRSHKPRCRQTGTLRPVSDVVRNLASCWTWWKARPWWVLKSWNHTS